MLAGAGNVSQAHARAARKASRGLDRWRRRVWGSGAEVAQGEWRRRSDRRHWMSQQQMRIGMSLRGHGYHLAAWRHPDVPVDASVRIDHYVRTAQMAERGAADVTT